MYQRRMGSYDEIPEGMKVYLNNYGCHFNKKLCDEAVNRMYKENDNGEKEYIKPYTKEQVEELLKVYGIKVHRGKMYDSCYVAAMAKSDFLGKSIPTEECLAKYIRDLIDDADAEEGFIFNRWYADQVFMNQPIDWEDMI